MGSEKSQLGILHDAEASTDPAFFDKIIECPKCCMAWFVNGITGEEIRLAGSSCERRLCEQKQLES